MPFDSLGQPQSGALLYVLPSGCAADAPYAADIAALRAAGLRVVTMAPAAWAGPSRQAAALPQGGVSGVLRAAWFAWRQRGVSRMAALAMGGRVAAEARQQRCGAIHAAAADASATAALIGGLLAGLPVTLAVQGCDVYVAPRDLALKIDAATAIAAPCRDLAEDLRRIAPRAPIAVVPRGVDPAWFAPAVGGVRIYRVLCLAPLRPQAGIEVLIAALAALPAALRPGVDVVGEGSLRAALEAEAAAAGVAGSLRFLGPRGRRWVAAQGPRYLGLVSPGIIAPDGDRDPAPEGVLQGMALGLPVVASRLMGLREMVTAECGHLVPPGDVAALATGLRWLSVMSEEHRRQLGRAARDRVLGHFTAAARARALVALSGPRAAVPA